MKNALAIACCVATLSTAAQSTVTVTGTIDAFAGRMRMAGDAGGVYVVNGEGLSPLGSVSSPLKTLATDCGPLCD